MMELTLDGIVEVLREAYSKYDKSIEFNHAFKTLLHEYIQWEIPNKFCKENRGKYTSQKFWSNAAIDAYNDRIRNVFVFEHVIPSHIIEEEIIKLFEENKKDEEIIEFINNNLTICVVTKYEDKDLTRLDIRSNSKSKYDELIKWNRYKEAGIEVYEVRLNQEKRRWQVERKEKIIF